jgi:hypothetical protein
MALFGNKTQKQAQTNTDASTLMPPIVSKIQHMYREAYSAKQPRTEKMKECYKAYNGELFDTNKGKDRGNAVINHIFSTIETIKPIMFSTLPKPIVIPMREDAFDKCIKIQRALEYEWRRSKLYPKIIQYITNGLIYGTSVIGLFWDEKDNSIGNVVPKIISPFNFFIDPMATSIDEAEYVMYAVYKSFGQLVKAYPEKKEELERSKTNDIDENLSFGKETQNVKNQLLYIECYMKDYATDTLFEDELDEEGNVTGNKYKVTKLKYPNGRRIVIAGDVLLYDGKNPYDTEKFPFVEWKCYDVPNEFWGISEAEVLISVNKEMCSLMNDVIDNAHLNGNPIWVVDKNSGVEKNSLTNRKGLVVRKNPGTEVTRQAPPPLPAYIQNIISDLKYDIQVLSGVFDATRGERPVSVTSGVAIESLQESSQGRIKLKTQNLETCLSDLSSLWLKMMQKFWSVPRTVTTMGGQYEPNTFILQGTNLAMEIMDKDDVDGDFDIEILTGSTMAVNRSARLEQIIRLAQTPAEDGMPIIDRRAVLEYTELDNVDDIIKRFEQAKLDQQMQQKQQEQDMANQQLQQQQVDKQNQQQQMMMQQQMDMQKNEQLHNMNLQNEVIKGLQSGQTNLQSKSDTGNGSLNELIQALSKMTPEELSAFIKKRPEVLKVIESINSEQAPKGNSQGGK